MIYRNTMFKKALSKDLKENYNIDPDDVVPEEEESHQDEQDPFEDKRIMSESNFDDMESYTVNVYQQALENNDKDQVIAAIALQRAQSRLSLRKMSMKIQKEMVQNKSFKNMPYGERRQSVIQTVDNIT